MSVVVLISGRGSNLQAIVDAGIAVSAVISNVAGAGGLDIAARRGIPARVVKHGDFPTREAFEEVLAAEVDRFAPKLVAHAGFMRIVLSHCFFSHELHEFHTNYSIRLLASLQSHLR